MLVVIGGLPVLFHSFKGKLYFLIQIVVLLKEAHIVDWNKKKKNVKINFNCICLDIVTE